MARTNSVATATVVGTRTLIIVSQLLVCPLGDDPETIISYVNQIVIFVGREAALFRVQLCAASLMRLVRPILLRGQWLLKPYRP
jgi:hypothetical protein